MRITFFKKDHGQCGQLRCFMPAQAIQELDLADAVVADCRMNHDQTAERVDKSDICVFQFPRTSAQLDFIEHAKANNWVKTVVDMDDDPWNVSPFNLLGYPGFGTQEVDWQPPGAEKPTPLWRDIRNPEAQGLPASRCIDTQANAERLARFTHALELADMVTTTCEPLADQFRKHNKNVFVWPNCLDFRYWRPYKPKRIDEWVRIGWHGGVSHYEDWHSVTKPLKAVLKKHKKTRLVIYGAVFEGTLKGFPKERMDYAQWCDVMMFPFVLAHLEFDIGICPLIDNQFNHCKSELKWEEYSALAIPTVASNCPPYSAAVEDRKTGFLVKDAKEWVDRLGELIENEKLRKDMGERAMCAVREKYDIQVCVRDLVGAYRSLLEDDDNGNGHKCGGPDNAGA